MFSSTLVCLFVSRSAKTTQPILVVIRVTLYVRVIGLGL